MGKGGELRRPVLLNWNSLTRSTTHVACRAYFIAHRRYLDSRLHDVLTF